MAFPKGAAADLAGVMSKNGMGSGEAPPDMPDDDGEKDEDQVYKEICGDAYDAMKSGSKDQFCQFMLELLERYYGDNEKAQGETVPGEEPEEGGE